MDKLRDILRKFMALPNIVKVLILVFIVFYISTFIPKKLKVKKPIETNISKASKIDSTAIFYQDSLEKVSDSLELLQWKKDYPKAAKILEKNPSWYRSDCRRLANNEIWNGMTLEHLFYLYGKPDAKHYEDGQFAYCYKGYEPSCFYDRNGDDKIDYWN